MEITVQHKFTLLFHALDVLFGVVNGGMLLAAGLDPLSVEVD